MNFNLFNSLILAGIIQGFLFAIVWLFTKKYRARETQFLISLIIVYSLSNLQYYLLDIGIFDYVRFYDLYQIPYSLLMPPLLLLYGLSLLKSCWSLKKIHLLLFAPFFCVMTLAVYYKVQLLQFNKPSGYSQFLDDIPTWGEFVAIIYSLIVLFYLLFKVTRSMKEHPYSVTDIKPQLSWFRNILIAQLISTILWTYSEISFSDSVENYYYYPLWIVLSIIIYWLGHIGIYKYGVTQERKKIRKERHSSYSVVEVRKQKNETIEALNRFIIEQKNYLNSQLTLEKTAQELNLSQGHLSKLINTELQQSFKEYLNNLRVEEAKSYLQNPDFSNYTLVAIGLEAGFNSKSAFNASFKKVTGITPSQFKAQIKN